MPFGPISQSERDQLLKELEDADDTLRLPGYNNRERSKATSKINEIIKRILWALPLEYQNETHPRR